MICAMLYCYTKCSLFVLLVLGVHKGVHSKFSQDGHCGCLGSMLLLTRQHSDPEGLIFYCIAQMISRFHIPIWNYVCNQAKCSL